MDAGLVVLCHVVKIQTGITGEHRHMKRVEIRLRLFPGIFQRRFSILDNLWLLNTAKIFQPDQLNSKTGKAVTHRVEFCRVAGSVQ